MEPVTATASPKKSPGMVSEPTSLACSMGEVANPETRCRVAACAETAGREARHASARSVVLKQRRRGIVALSGANGSHQILAHREPDGFIRTKRHREGIVWPPRDRHFLDPPVG